MLGPRIFLDLDLQPLFNDILARSDRLCWDGRKLVQKGIMSYCQTPKSDHIDGAAELLLRVQQAAYVWNVDKSFVAARNLLGLNQKYVTKALAFLERREREKDNLKLSDKASDKHHSESGEEMKVQMESGEGLVTKQARDAERDSIVKEKRQIIIFAIKAWKLSRQVK